MNRKPKQPWNLAARQRLVLTMICDKKTPKQIAEELRLSPRTIEAHLRRIREKMGGPSLLVAALMWDRLHRPAGV